MKKIIIVILTVFFCSGYIHIYGQDYGFKGSYTSVYDSTSEQAVLNKIEADTDPKTEKVILDGRAFKFEYIDNLMNYDIEEGYKVLGVYFTDEEGEWHVFEYYVDNDKVAKIVMLTTNGSKQIYSEEQDTDSKNN